ncbi:hypothetical protein Ddc_14887 [Ditylenchus destructor]|nr:hypothetical protein Ddc_14887 [Ditylenchus destructor]
MKPFQKKTVSSLFVSLIYLCPYVFPLPWFPAHTSMMRSSMGFELSNTAQLNYGHSKPTISSKRFFQWHFPTELWLGNHLQAMVGPLAVAKMNQQRFQKDLRKLVQVPVNSLETDSQTSDQSSKAPSSASTYGNEKTEIMGDLDGILPEVVPKKSTHGKKGRRKNPIRRSAKDHSTLVNVELAPEQTAAISVRDCMFLPGSACTTVRRTDSMKFSDYLDKIVELIEPTESSEKVV